MLILTVTARDGATEQITLSIPPVMSLSTSAVYSDVETVDPPGTIVPAGSRAGYVVMEPANWTGIISLSDSRFVAAPFNGNTYVVNTTVDLPARVAYSMTMDTNP